MTTNENTSEKKNTLFKFERMLEDGSVINLLEPLPEKTPAKVKLRYEVSGSDEVIKPDVEENNKKKLTARQELFCQYYCINEETRFNATVSYALAYGYDLDSASTEVIKDNLTGEVLKKSERQRLEAICAAAASQSLRRVNIQARFTELFNSLKKDEIVDREMMKLIIGPDGASKREMIKEYNKLMQRIVERTKDEGAGEIAKAKLYEEIQAKISTMTPEEIDQTLQQLLTK